MKTNSEILEQYLSQLKELNIADNTRLVYYRRATDFISFLAASNLQVADLELTSRRQEQCELYKQKLAGQGVSANSICCALSAIDHFFRLCCGWKTFVTRPERAPIQPVQKIDLGGYKQVFAELDHLSIRDRAIMLLIACLGLKADECSELNTSNLIAEGNEKFLLVNSKKPRLLKLGDLCAAAVHTWLEQRAQAGMDDEEALFLAKSGGRLSTLRIYRLIRQAGIRTGTAVTARRLRQAALVNMSGTEYSDTLVAMNTGAKPSTIRRYKAML